MTQSLIALLGRKDEPTDAVESYCEYLGAALHPLGFKLDIRRVPWEKHGWSASLDALKLQSAEWRGKWILVQYTALAWSGRGFPQKFLRVLRLLKSAGARVGVVFHDVEPFAGSRFVDRIRRSVQLHTMRKILSNVDSSIFTVPLEKISWLPARPPSATFIPVGPNLPIPDESTQIPVPDGVPTIGVFSITGGDVGERETQIIIAAVRHVVAQIGKVHLSVFGRHAELREAALREGLRGISVDLSVEGVIEDTQVVDRLFRSHVLFFIRGAISSRRGSAIAGIACGLPLVAYAGTETAPPVTDAGILFFDPDRPEQAHSALVKILQDAKVRGELAARSRASYKADFCWPSIAARFARILDRK